ncbi:NUDIX hydrolase [Clostridium ljungdahlii]|uniref:NUDIX hydrolase n=1 Tax=Clostridium ljungdahlii TaxID=1538 RepID=UPI003864531F
MIDKINDIFKSRKANMIGHYNKNSVMIPLCSMDGELNLLFEVRSLNLKHQPGDICFPGGKMEKGEIPKDTAIRETMEELNLNREDIEFIGDMDYIVTPYNFIMYPFVCKLNREDISPSKEEVDHVFTVPLNFFIDKEPVLHEIEIVPHPKEDFPYNLIIGGENYKFRRGKMPSYFYTYKDYIIWGFTALIIKKFTDIIKNEI